MDRGVCIVTDSGGALPVRIQDAYGVEVVPLRLEIAGKEYLEGVNISPPHVVAALLGGKKVRVYEPPVEDFDRVFRNLALYGYSHIVSVHISGAVHDVVTRARTAAERAPVPVSVVDTRTMAFAQGFAALAAATVAHAGGTPAAVEAEARRVAETASLLFTVETMDYVHRDGRVPAPIKALSNATRTRPVLGVRDGEVKLAARIHNTAPAREHVREQIARHVATLANPAVAVALVGGGAIEAGLGIESPTPVMEMSPGASLTAHAGPGTYVAAAADMPAAFTATPPPRE